MIMEILPTLEREQRQKLWESQQRKICESKHKYLSENAALSRGNYYDNHSRRTKKSSKVSRVYKCPWCTYFHLSTK